MSTLIFEEPPEVRRGPGGTTSPIGAWLNSLRAHPGEWVKYPHRVHPSTTTMIRKATHYGVAVGEFETAGRNITHRPARLDLYARYIGGDA